MSAAHTKGPWKTGDSDCRIIVGPATRFNARSLAGVAVVDESDDPAEDAANARLIAAAPELLAALKALKEWGCTYTGPRDANSPHALLVAAHEAIAKAEGAK